jgi:MFS family permease
MRLFAAFYSRSFAVLWIAQTLSRLGDRVYFIALAWWVVATTGSAVAMGVVLLANLVPTLLLLMVGGVVVDRWSRARLMLVSDVARGLLVGSAAILAAAGLLAMPGVLALSVAFGAVDAFFDPAYTAIVPQLVPAELRPSANSLTELSRRLAGVVGPALGAVVVAVAGVPTAFALDSVSFGMSALGMLVISRQVATTPPRETPGNVLQEAREGLRAVLAVPWLWITILVASITNITLAGPLGAVMPMLVTRHFGGGVALLGGLEAMAGVGSVCAAVWLGSRSRLRHRGLLVYLPWIACALAAAALGLPISVAAAGALMLMVGASLTTAGLVWTNTLQEFVPQNLLGRVSSIDFLGSAALIPIGFVGAGAMADMMDPATVFRAGGLATAVMLTAALLHPAIRRLD